MNSPKTPLQTLLGSASCLGPSPGSAAGCSFGPWCRSVAGLAPLGRDMSSDPRRKAAPGSCLWFSDFITAPKEISAQHISLVKQHSSARGPGTPCSKHSHLAQGGQGGQTPEQTPSAPIPSATTAGAPGLSTGSSCGGFTSQRAVLLQEGFKPGMGLEESIKKHGNSTAPLHTFNIESHKGLGSKGP